MKSIRDRLGIVVAICVFAAAMALAETEKPETTPAQQKPHNNMRRARESNAAAPTVLYPSGLTCPENTSHRHLSIVSPNGKNATFFSACAWGGRESLRSKKRT